jgi:M6 family metalloprotease-like protein
LWSASLLQAQSSFSCAGQGHAAVRSRAAAKPLKNSAKFLPSKGRIHALVVFAQFRDEAPSPVPDFAEDLFDPHLPGSLAHFYHTMSFGQLQVQGTVLPGRYTSARPASSYLATAPGEKGSYDQFVQEILASVDPDLDFRLFDSDGPDGRPDSGDDDGFVDYLFIHLHAIPSDFLLGAATGIAGLGTEEDYPTADPSSRGDPIRLSGLASHGAILQEGAFSQTVGSMAHEFGHGLGLPDLYDTSFQTAPDQAPAQDSAGIGRWGLMGWGAHGWQGDDGPGPFCAWSLEQLGWIGADNDRLVNVSADVPNLEIADLHQGGSVYRIPLRADFIPEELTYAEEYLLLEYRARESHYYNRHLPAQGMLVWHVRSHVASNDLEENKLVDLVCADGLYADAAYPLGKMVDAGGGDNLDFWAHEASYRTQHQGNLGDVTDPFDGVRFTRLALDSNPSTRILGRPPADASTGVSLEKIRRQGPGLLVDVAVPHWAGLIREMTHWQGEVLVDGDLTIAPEGALVVHPDTRVRFAGQDRQRSGADPARCELRVEGELRVLPGRRISRYTGEGIEVVETKTPVFEALVPGERWYGILADEAARLQIPSDLILRDAEYSLPAAGIESEAALQATAVLGKSAPAALQLLPNFPNPFNAETVIRYVLPATSQVRLGIYNALGQKVLTLVDARQPVGMQVAMWDGRDESGRAVAGGAYFYRLEVEGQAATVRPMLLVR